MRISGIAIVSSIAISNYTRDGIVIVARSNFRYRTTLFEKPPYPSLGPQSRRTPRISPSNMLKFETLHFSRLSGNRVILASVVLSQYTRSSITFTDNQQTNTMVRQPPNFSQCNYEFQRTIRPQTDEQAWCEIFHSLAVALARSLWVPLSAVCSCTFTSCCHG